MRTPAALFFALLTLMLAPADIGAQPVLRPVDQAAQQPDFFSFRAQLLVTLAKRDVDGLIAVLHKDIKNSFGGNDGVEEFRATWFADRRGASIWETLTAVLALGGTFTRDGQFSAPYVFSSWPRDLVGYDYVVITGTGVRVRSRASASASQVAAVSYSILEVPQDLEAPESWVAVKLPSGVTGYVDRRYARSPVDYRATFQKVDGKWQMSALIAGDQRAPPIRPNPSSEARPNGKAPGPRGYFGYHPPRGPSALPSVPPQFEL